MCTDVNICFWPPLNFPRAVVIDVDRRITLAYVMNKVASVAVIAQALAERVSEIVKR